MTTTDDGSAGRADRLARLRERRSGGSGAGSDAGSDAGAGIGPEPTPFTADPPTDDAVRRGRSPATTARIVTVGASTTAVLGMMAGYGMADRAAAMKPSFEVPVPAPTPDSGVAAGDITAATPATIAPATTTPSTIVPATTTPPQVIVVVIDGATGLPIDQSALAEMGTIDVLAPDTAPPSTSTVVPDTVPSAAPVAVPVAVDLAVPKPPPAPASRTAPQPQADSGGS